MFSVNIHFKEVKVVCFDEVLEVLILSNLPCRKVAQEFMAFSPEMKQERPPRCCDIPKKKNGSWAVADHNTFQCQNNPEVE